MPCCNIIQIENINVLVPRSIKLSLGFCIIPRGQSDPASNGSLTPCKFVMQHRSDENHWGLYKSYVKVQALKEARDLFPPFFLRKAEWTCTLENVQREESSSVSALTGFIQKVSSLHCWLGVKMVGMSKWVNNSCWKIR